MTNKKVSRILTISVIILFVITPFATVSAQRIEVEENEIGQLDRDSSRLWMETDPNADKRHFTYLIGDEVDIEPSGRNVTNLHVFKYGQTDVNTSEIIFRENVTDTLVYPFHYNFVVANDSSIHTSFVANNYTVYYAMRDTSGDWSYEEVNSPDEWFGWAPTIELGNDGQPRLVYSVSFKENADSFFGVPAELTSIRSIIYSIKNNGGWEHFDVGDNHGILARNPSLFNIYNPGLFIEDGISYIAFNNRLQLAAESRIYYMAIPEIPTEIVQNSSDNFENYHHKYVVISSTIATIFSRPIMKLVGEGIVIGTGSFTFGGAFISYNNDRFEVPASDKSRSRNQWQSFEVDKSLRTKESENIDLIKTGINEVTIVYSMYDLYNPAENIFEHNVIIKTYGFNLETEFLSPDEGEGMTEGAIDRITDVTNIHHTYTNIMLINDTVEINYLKFVTGASPTLTQVQFSFAISANDNSVRALIVIITSSISIVGGFSILITKLVDRPEEEEELLPHMINLKEAITED